MEGAANKLRIGSLTAPAAVFGTLHMDLVYHDNNLSTYENASDSDFLYVDSGSGATFLVEPTRSSTLNDMSDGDRLYFAQTGIGSSAFQVNQEILLMNSNRLYDKNLLVKNDQNTTADGYEDWYLTTNTEHEPDSDELNPNGRVPGSAYTAALAVWRDSDTLLKRLGELRYSREEQGTWARYSRRKLEKEHDHTFTTKLNALQIGYDTKRTGEKGDWYYGAVVRAEGILFLGRVEAVILHDLVHRRKDVGNGDLFRTTRHAVLAVRAGDGVDLCQLFLSALHHLALSLRQRHKVFHVRQIVLHLLDVRHAAQHRHHAFKRGSKAHGPRSG